MFCGVHVFSEGYAVESEGNFLLGCIAMRFVKYEYMYQVSLKHQFISTKPHYI
jgi:hypothetical protein